MSEYGNPVESGELNPNTQKTPEPENNFKTMRDALRIQREAFKTAQSLEKESFTNPNLIKKWDKFDSSYASFDSEFKSILPYGILTHLDLRRVGFKKEAIGIELGGPGSRLFAEMSDLFQRSLGVTANDLRQDINPNQIAIDEENRHEIIEADMFSPKALAEVDKWLNGEKADLIIERMLGGWGMNFYNRNIFGKYMERWYERLSDRGTMLFQFPGSFGHLPEEIKMLESWIERFNFESQGKARAQVDADHNVMIIEKMNEEDWKLERGFANFISVIELLISETSIPMYKIVAFLDRGAFDEKQNEYDHSNIDLRYIPNKNYAIHSDDVLKFTKRLADWANKNGYSVDKEKLLRKVDNWLEENKTQKDKN